MLFRSTVEQIKTTNQFADLATAQFWFAVGDNVGVQFDVSGGNVEGQPEVESVVLDASNHAIITFTNLIYEFPEDDTITNGLVFNAGGVPCDDATCDTQGNIYVLESTEFMNPPPIVGLIYDVGYIDASGVCHHNSSKIGRAHV